MPSFLPAITPSSSEALQFSRVPLVRATAYSRLRAVLAMALLGSALSGCASVMPDYTPNFSWVYKIDVQQGVVVTQEMIRQIKPGMTREQVRFVMGTPLLNDVFHTNRWDYPYLYQPGRGTAEERKVSLFFEDNRLARVEADLLPTEQEFTAGRKLIRARNAQPKGFFSSLFGRKTDETAPATAPATVAAPAAATDPAPASTPADTEPKK